MPEHPTNDAIHCWFGLSYSNYLVLARTVLQSMPDDLQQRFVDCLEEMASLLNDEHLYATYTIQMRDKRGRFIKDPLADYERGRRRIELRAALPTETGGEG